MKTLPILLLLLSIGIIIFFGIDGIVKWNKKQLKRQAEIDNLRKENMVQRDSLENVLKVTQDSLDIAFETIQQATAEREKAHVETQRLIKRYEKIIYVRFANDSARVRALTELFPAYPNP